jgi:hypothetical protein
MVRASFPQVVFAKRALAKPCRSFSAANSLSLKILPLTHLDSGFWRVKPTFSQRNPNKFRILQIQKKKNCEISFALGTSPTVPQCPLWFIFTSQ